MKHTLTIVSNLLLLLSALAALILFVPRAGGMGTYAVLSSSMEPALPVGSIIYTRPVTDIREIKEQDIISFQTGQILVAHRVLSVNRDAGTLITKGDANKVEDAVPVDAADVTGIVRWYIPYFGYILKFLETKTGRLTICLTALVLLVLMQILSRFEEKTAGALAP